MFSRGEKINGQEEIASSWQLKPALALISATPGAESQAERVLSTSTSIQPSLQSIHRFQVHTKLANNAP